jgi:hypothetical protein
MGGETCFTGNKEELAAEDQLTRSYRRSRPNALSSQWQELIDPRAAWSEFQDRLFP